MSAYYNEIEPFAADWLENLIAEGHIAPGVVDRRDIRDVVPSDLLGFTQCHFCAGLGAWSYAMRRAGWPDDRPAWTGSFPCQPFSAAGAGVGFADERHLWPHGHHLIGVCRPPVFFGEQVASKNADPWVDLVHFDLEALGYAFGCVPFPAAGIGAPHIRDRNYWVADSMCERGDARNRGAISSSASSDQRTTSNEGHGHTTAHRSSIGRLDHHHHQGSQGYPGDGDGGCGWTGSARPASEAGVPSRISDTPGSGRGEERPHGGGSGSGDRAEGRPTGHSSSSSADWVADDDSAGLSAGSELRLHGAERDAEYGRAEDSARPGPTNGHWRDADWLLCRDGKWRPVEPGTFPLVNGAPSRVGRLRAYGNAIVAQAAEEFIRAYLEHERDAHLAAARGLTPALAIEDLLG